MCLQLCTSLPHISSGYSNALRLKIPSRASWTIWDLTSVAEGSPLVPQVSRRQYVYSIDAPIGASLSWQCRATEA